MGQFGVETPEERRRRYLRLARAATETAAKTPLDSAKEMYLKLAEAWRAMAEEHEQGQDDSYDTQTDSGTGVPPPEEGLNDKLKQNP